MGSPLDEVPISLRLQSILYLKNSLNGLYSRYEFVHTLPCYIFKKLILITREAKARQEQDSGTQALALEKQAVCELKFRQPKESMESWDVLGEGWIAAAGTAGFTSEYWATARHAPAGSEATCRCSGICGAQRLAARLGQFS